ncbi:uncharacterized protein LOC120206599 [Hibiscus syriacus]|uniref:uncharacterized protein LOC120206599 n=1 Tax=Hibiscus syriacus TaxID=106335 RepID=UPI00192089E5|nr:uncharacterized protein LOC120206599 [Hibiscus syriacus]
MLVERNRFSFVLFLHTTSLAFSMFDNYFQQLSSAAISNKFARLCFNRYLSWSKLYRYTSEELVSAAKYVLSILARIFPIYFPMGNMATNLFVIFSLIVGVISVATSVTGVTDVLQWNGPSLCVIASSSLLTWALTMLAMGLACKEIYIGWTYANLRTWEVMTIIASATQLFCTGAIHAGAGDFAPTTLAAGTV